MYTLHHGLLSGLIGLLVQQMGDESYRKRELAHQALRPMTWAAAYQLEQAANHHDAEIALRSARLYAPIREQKLERVAFTLRPKMPWLYLPDSYELHYWVEFAEKQYKAPGGGPDWPNYRMATKLYTKQLLLFGRSTDEIQALLDHMEQMELDWIRRYQPQQARRD